MRVADRAWRRLRLEAKPLPERPLLLSRALLNAFCPKENRTEKVEADYLKLSTLIIQALEEPPPSS